MRGGLYYGITYLGIPDGNVAIPKSVFGGVRARAEDDVKDCKAKLDGLMIVPKSDRKGGVEQTIQSIKEEVRTSEERRTRGTKDGRSEATTVYYHGTKTNNLLLFASLIAARGCRGAPRETPAGGG